MDQSPVALHSYLPNWKTVARAAAALVIVGALGACAYRIDIQQGNVIEEESVDQIQLGMSRSAVQFLLGTPMVADAFHQQRWDYTYYFRRGRSREIERRWDARRGIGV